LQVHIELVYCMGVAAFASAVVRFYQPHSLNRATLTERRQSMKYLQVKDWDKFQHYKDRNPPWIKLETDTFMKYEFGLLSDASKLLAVCIWTLASRYKDPKLGLVPADLEYIKRQCNLGNLIKNEHLKELIEQGFIVDASNALADCKQSARPETYSKEGYSKEAEQRRNIDRFENFWNEYGKIGSKQNALKAFNRIKGVEYETIIAGLRKYQEWARANTWYSPKHASTWLNAKGWEDEYTIQQQPPATKSKHQRAKEALGLSAEPETINVTPANMF